MNWSPYPHTIPHQEMSSICFAVVVVVVVVVVVCVCVCGGGSFKTCNFKQNLEISSICVLKNHKQMINEISRMPFSKLSTCMQISSFVRPDKTHTSMLRAQSTLRLACMKHGLSK